MTTSLILEQPIECLDAIALEIDAAKDLLALSLTCKALHALVFYRHLRFRVISCRVEDSRSIEVWDLLAQDRALARSVRVLELHPVAYVDPRHIIPFKPSARSKRSGKIAKKAKANSEPLSMYELLADAVTAHLIPALRNMSRLVAFTWGSGRSQNHCPLFTGVGFDPQDIMSQIWPALNKCTNISRLAIQQPSCQGTSFFQVIQRRLRVFNSVTLILTPHEFLPRPLTLNLLLNSLGAAPSHPTWCCLNSFWPEGSRISL